MHFFSDWKLSFLVICKSGMERVGGTFCRENMAVGIVWLANWLCTWIEESGRGHL
jgi:hypothetical protein